MEINDYISTIRKGILKKMRCLICNQLIIDNTDICLACESKIKIEQIEDDCDSVLDSILENINKIVEEYDNLKEIK